MQPNRAKRLEDFQKPASCLGTGCGMRGSQLDQEVAMAGFSKGQKVQWNWGTGTAEGKVVERFERRVQRTIKSAKVVKNGSKDNPAFLIEQENGGKVLKLGSELSG